MVSKDLGKCTEETKFLYKRKLYFTVFIKVQIRSLNSQRKCFSLKFATVCEIHLEQFFLKVNFKLSLDGAFKVCSHCELKKVFKDL